MTSWNADLANPVYDPARVLDAAAFPKTEWAVALARGEKQDAAASYVASLRQGPPRWNPADSFAAIYRSWYGKEVGCECQADDVMKHRFAAVYGIEHQFAGEIDWLFDPTKEWGGRQTKEWQVSLNRHYFWAPLARAYEETGDAKYATEWENQLRGWIRQCPRPASLPTTTPTAWRTIEAGIRAGWTWPVAFEAFRQCPHVSDEALWLFVCAMREHGAFLLRYPQHRNFKTMETAGLAHTGMLFYEMQDAYSFASTAIDRAVAELERQFYPDGTQIELAPAYSLVCLSNLLTTLKLAGFYRASREKYPSGHGDGLSVPVRTWTRLAEQVEALGQMADPDGVCPALHDSPVARMVPVYEDLARRLETPRFAKPHWKTPGCTLLPWGGYAVMRRENSWALLDAGPFGAAHQHQDAMQLLIHAHGKPFCIDSGKPHYDTSLHTRFLRSSAAHNVVQMDEVECGVDPNIRVAQTPLPMALIDRGSIYITAATRSMVQARPTERHFLHERIVCDITTIGWLVFDQLTPDDDRPHHWEWLWHMPVDEIKTDAQTAAASYRNGPSLRVEVRGSIAGKMSVMQGQDEPCLRGWQILDAKLTPLSVLRFITQPVTGPVRMCTLLTPASATMDSVELIEASTTVKLHDMATVTLRGPGQITQIDFHPNRGEPISIPLESHGPQ